jgi:hypothetical protein
VKKAAALYFLVAVVAFAIFPSLLTVNRPPQYVEPGMTLGGGNMTGIDTSKYAVVPKVAPAEIVAVGVDSTALAQAEAARDEALKKAEQLAAKLAQAEAELAQKPVAVDTTIQRVVAKKTVIGKPLEYGPPVEDLRWVVYNHSGDSISIISTDGKMLAKGDSVVTIPRIPIGTRKLSLVYGEKREVIEVNPNQLPSVVVWVGFYPQGDYFGFITVARVEVIDDNPLDEIQFSLMGGDTLLSSSRLEPGKWSVSAEGDKIILKEKVERYRFSFSVADPSHNPRVFSSSFAVVKKGRVGILGWLIGD